MRHKNRLGEGVRDSRPFAQTAKGQGTLSVADAIRVKGWATRHPDGGLFSLAALVSTGSRTLTGSCSAAPFQGWSVTPPPDAVGGAKTLTPETNLRDHHNVTPDMQSVVRKVNHHSEQPNERRQQPKITSWPLSAD